MDSRETDATLIAQELFYWSEQCLEPDSPRHGDLPACPFAHSEWRAGNVIVNVTDDLDAVIEVKAHFPPTHEQTHIFAWLNYQDLTPDQFSDWLDEQNRQHFGVWLMGFHPDAPEDPNIPALELPDDWPESDDYAVILMQSLSRIVAASDTLLGTGYYANYDADDMKIITQRKESDNAWQEKVDEAVYHAQDEAQIWLKQEKGPQ